MKTKVLLTIILLGFALFANAQIYAPEINVKYTTSDGKVGIGTPTPSATLDVNTEGSFSFRLQRTHISQANAWVFRITNSDPSFYIKSRSLFIHPTQYNADLAFGINPNSAPSFIIKGEGNIGIGKNNPIANAKLDVAGNIYMNGTIVSGSDRNLKKDIKEYQGGLNLIKKIKPYSYKYKPRKIPGIINDTINVVPSGFEYETDPDTYIGVIAQDIKELEPKLVHTIQEATENEEEMLGIDYSGFIGVLINAVKEQQTLIEELQKEINAIKDNSK